MEDQLITFETAKLAKEKGFDWKVTHHYRNGLNYDKELFNGGNPYNMNCSEEQKLWSVMLYSAPTQSLLQKWLREKKILIEVRPVDDWDCWNYQIAGEDFLSPLRVLLKRISEYPTYEEALEEGLKDGLRLINNIK